MSSTTDFFGKADMLMSRFAGGQCFGVKLQSDFQPFVGSCLFAYLLKRTLSKSVLVLVGLESCDDSELQSTTVLLRP